MRMGDDCDMNREVSPRQYIAQAKSLVAKINELSFYKKVGDTILTPLFKGHADMDEDGYIYVPLWNEQGNSRTNLKFDLRLFDFQYTRWGAVVFERDEPKNIMMFLA